ncbi:24554_t:CDS:2 [Gigaspora margarita]|uniref:24554_t:CDS:1 n=1 Tax=Gigaspora margarita TaxID=4874 RepID=A0ABN7UD42_GIGMA|nr:24554_t:CDS:2 [Gigaspora margarita]
MGSSLSSLKILIENHIFASFCCNGKVTSYSAANGSLCLKYQLES